MTKLVKTKSVTQVYYNGNIIAELSRNYILIRPHLYDKSARMFCKLISFFTFNDSFNPCNISLIGDNYVVTDSRNSFQRNCKAEFTPENEGQVQVYRAKF